MPDCVQRRGQRRVKLLLVIGSFTLGGIERLVTDVCRVLVREGRYDVSICCLEGRRGPFLKDVLSLGVPVHDCPRRSRGQFLTFARDFYRLLRTVKPDIVHSHLHWSLPWQIAAAKLARVRSIVVTQHRLSKPRRLALARWKAYAILTRHFVDRFTAVSEAVSENIAQHGWASVSDIAIIRNGVDLSVFNTDCVERDAARERIGVGRSALVGTVGNFRPDKGHKYLVEAARKVLDSGTDCHFVLVGSGSLRTALEEQVDQLDLRTNFSFLGARRDIPEILRAMDVFVLPSVSEGLPIALIEGIASGVPSVGTRVGGIPEVLDDGMAGILVPPKDPSALADAIVRVLTDSELASRLSKAARERAKGFSIEACVAKYEELYQRLLTRNGRYLAKKAHRALQMPGKKQPPRESVS